MYFRDADACILVYDLTDLESFENMRKVWLTELKSKAPENLCLALIGNKSDLCSEGNPPAVDEEQALAVAKESGAIIHKHVSAKKN